MRQISIENAKLISRSIIRESYKIDDETMVTFSVGPEPLEQIELERENAKTCLALGIPALFSYEMVQCGDKVGVIYEHMLAKTLGHQIMEDPDHLERYAALYADSLKKKHSIHVAPGKLPFIEDDYRRSLEAMKGLLTDEEIEKCSRLVDAVPDRDTFLAMGFNPGTALYKDGEIYMNSFNYTSYGNPLFELADLCESISFVAAGATSDSFVRFLTNMDRPTTARLWDRFLHNYFDFKTEEEYIKMDGFIHSFAMLKMTMVAVDVPNLHEDMKAAALKSCREKFLPHVGELTEQVRNINL